MHGKTLQEIYWGNQVGLRGEFRYLALYLRLLPELPTPLNSHRVRNKAKLLR